MRSNWAGAAVLSLMVAASPAFVQQSSMEELMRPIDALQQCVNEIEHANGVGHGIGNRLLAAGIVRF